MNRLISILLKIFPYAYKKDRNFTRMLTGILFEWLGLWVIFCLYISQMLYSEHTLCNQENFMEEG